MQPKNSPIVNLPELQEDSHQISLLTEGNLSTNKLPVDSHQASQVAEDAYQTNQPQGNREILS